MISMIIYQLKQYLKIRKYGDHYLVNIIRIIFRWPIIDYRVISHKNRVVHSCLTDRHEIISKRNYVVRSTKF